MDSTIIDSATFWFDVFGIWELGFWGLGIGVWGSGIWGLGFDKATKLWYSLLIYRANEI